MSKIPRSPRETLDRCGVIERLEGTYRGVVSLQRWLRCGGKPYSPDNQLTEARLTLASALRFVRALPFDHITGEERATWVALARAEHAVDGECEIDDNALVSQGDDPGAYVQAWVWVSRDDEPDDTCDFCLDATGSSERCPACGTVGI